MESVKFYNCWFSSSISIQKIAENIVEIQLDPNQWSRVIFIAFQMSQYIKILDQSFYMLVHLSQLDEINEFETDKTINQSKIEN